MVFRILDLFLCEGLMVIFSVALALLKTSQRDLLALDFEGVLKYFRVYMPKKFRVEANFKDLMTVWASLHGKLTEKRLKKYEKIYAARKEEEALKQDPLIRYERECKQLTALVRRLEQENDDLANEYIDSKIALSKQLEDLRDDYEVVKTELVKYKTDYQNRINESNDTNKKLLSELEQIKKMWRKESEKYQGEIERTNIIISEYKQICNTLSGKVRIFVVDFFLLFCLIFLVISVDIKVEKSSGYKKKKSREEVKQDLIRKMNLCVDCIQKNQSVLENNEKQIATAASSTGVEEQIGETTEDDLTNPSTTTPPASGSSNRKNSSSSTSSSDSFIDLNLEDPNLTKVRESGNNNLVIVDFYFNLKRNNYWNKKKNHRLNKKDANNRNGFANKGLTSESSLEEDQSNKIKQLELELARVKLELVDAQCRNQEFDYKLKTMLNNVNLNGQDLPNEGLFFALFLSS